MSPPSTLPLLNRCIAVSCVHAKECIDILSCISDWFLLFFFVVAVTVRFALCRRWLYSFVSSQNAIGMQWVWCDGWPWPCKRQITHICKMLDLRDDSANTMHCATYLFMWMCDGRVDGARRSGEQGWRINFILTVILSPKIMCCWRNAEINVFKPKS